MKNKVLWISKVKRNTEIMLYFCITRERFCSIILANKRITGFTDAGTYISAKLSSILSMDFTASASFRIPLIVVIPMHFVTQFWQRERNKSGYS